jgi:hypothetical protein
VPELAVFDGRMVNTITIEQMSAAVEAIHIPWRGADGGGRRAHRERDADLEAGLSLPLLSTISQ